jgi:hypothetical protein
MHDIYEHHIDTQCAWQQIEKNRRWPIFFPFDVGYSFSAIDELIPGQNATMHSIKSLIDACGLLNKTIQLG